MGKIAPFKLSDEDVKKIVKLLKQGTPVAEIAEQFNVTPQTIYYHISKIEKMTGKPLLRRVGKHADAYECRNLAIRFYREGMSIKEIARILEVKESTVKAYLHGVISQRIGRKPKLSPNDLPKVYQMVLKGATLQEVAKNLNVSESTLRAFLNRSDLSKYPELQWRTDKRLPLSRKKRVAEMLRRGESPVHVSSKTGIPLYVINKIKREISQEQF